MNPTLRYQEPPIPGRNPIARVSIRPSAIQASMQRRNTTGTSMSIQASAPTLPSAMPFSV